MITDKDPAELPEASTEPKANLLECVCPSCGKNGDASCPHCGSNYHLDSPVEDYGFAPSTPAELLAKFAQLARFISEKRNAKFWWACFLIATGDAHADGITMSQLGDQWKVGKACVSKTCVEICARLGIRPSRYMKDESSKEKYRRANFRQTKKN